MLGLVLGIITIFLSLALGGFAIYHMSFYFKKGDAKHAKPSVIFGLLTIMSIITAALSFSTFTITDAQSVYVVTEWGQVKGVVNAAGFQNKSPFEEYHKFDKKVRSTQIIREVYTSDLQAVEVTFTIEYQVDPTNLVELYLKYNTLEQVEALLANPIWSVTENVARNYTARELTTLKGEYVADVQSELSNSFNPYFVIVYQIRLTNTVYTPAFEDLLQQTLLAEQELLKQKAELDKQLQAAEYAVLIAEQKALEDLAQAEGEANAALARALGDAAAIEAIAKANALAYSSKLAYAAQALGFDVTTAGDGSLVVDTDGHDQEEIDALLSYIRYLEYLAVWDGVLPTIITDSSGIILNP